MNAQPDTLAIGDTILSWCSQCTEVGMPTEHRFEGNKLTCLECHPAVPGLRPEVNTTGGTLGDTSGIQSSNGDDAD